MAQARLASTWENPKSYKRIRIVERNDIELTYPIIAAYVEKPELALPVETLVLDVDSWPQERRHYAIGQRDAEMLESAKPVREDAHKAIENYVGTLGLGEDTTQRMLRALDWKKRYLKGEKPETNIPEGFNDHNREYGYVAAIVLMSLCSNITTLHLGGVGWNGPLKEYMMKSNYGLLQQPGLQKLRHVVFYPEDYWTSIHSDSYLQVQFLDWFRYFHRLPEIQSVTLEGVMEYQNERGLFPPGTSNVKSLHFGHSDLSSSMLGTLIRMHKGLEEFSLSLGGMWGPDGGGPSVYPKTLGKSLLTQKDTLRVLDLDIDIAYTGRVKYDGTIIEEEDKRYGDEDESLASEKDEWFRLDEATGNGDPLWVEQLPNTRPYGLTMGSLHDFTALKRLTVGVKFLFGQTKGYSQESPFQLATEPPFRLVDALPPNLEYLCLRGYYKGENRDIDDHINELLDKQSSRFAQLEEIKGIDVPVPGLEVVYGEGGPSRSPPPDENFDDEDSRHWIRPEQDLDWVEA